MYDQSNTWRASFHIIKLEKIALHTIIDFNFMALFAYEQFILR